VKILVTGSDGLVGGEVCRVLVRSGHECVHFDRADGSDVQDLPALEAAAADCDGVIHCAALLGGTDETPEQIMAVNVLGTWNVLEAARRRDIRRVVNLSSVDVLGVFKGERSPDYLPLDDSHPCYPGTPYGISKYLAEQMCRLCASADVSIVSLRPPGVWNAQTYQWIVDQRTENTEFEWSPFWEYGAFIDVRDLADACRCALEISSTGYRSLLVAADDITTSGSTSRELSARLHPEVPWQGDVEYQRLPYRTLLRNDAAKALLKWQPVFSWADFVAQKSD